MSQQKYGTYKNEQSVKRKAEDQYLIVKYTDGTYEMFPPDKPVGFFNETNKFVLAPSHVVEVAWRVFHYPGMRKRFVEVNITNKKKYKSPQGRAKKYRYIINPNNNSDIQDHIAAQIHARKHQGF